MKEVSPEKSRYLNRGPTSPVDMNQLKRYLNSFSQEHLVEIVFLSAQYDSVLWKALSLSIGIRLAKDNLEEIRIVLVITSYSCARIGSYYDHDPDSSMGD